jgi:hypothetical protein
VVGRDVEHLEVGEVVLDLRALVDHEPELAEDLGDLAHRLDARVEAAAADLAARRRDIDRLGRQATGQGGATEVGASLGEGRLDVASDGVGDGTDPRPIVGRERPDPAQDGGQTALLAEDIDVERLERSDVAGRRDRRERLVAQRLEFAGQVRQVHGLPLRIVLPGITSPRASSTSRAPTQTSRRRCA